MSVVIGERQLSASAMEIWELWSDLERWGSFVEGFARVSNHIGNWPAKGACLQWESTPHGRGLVSERVCVSEQPHELTVEVDEQRLLATKRMRTLQIDDGVLLRVEFRYRLKGPPWIRGLTDWLFVRRALDDSLQRELERFINELEDPAKASR